MKKITSFFATASGPDNKKARTREPTELGLETEEMEIIASVSNVSELSNSELGEQSETTKDWPSCWNLDQRNEFLLKNEWPCVFKMKLGCTPCRKVRNESFQRVGQQ